MLRGKGFSDKWIGWIHNNLSTGSSSVWLNGILGKLFNCLRGVRQGDPISPLLFVSAADLLQSVINKAWQTGILKHPLSDDFGGEFPIVQYADGTLLILPGDARTLFNLKGLLRSFSNSTGLHVNFAKSFLVPINMDENKATHLARLLAVKLATCHSLTWDCLLEQQSLAYKNTLPCWTELKRGSLGWVNFYPTMEDWYLLI